MFESHCTPCRGIQGNGDGALARILKPPPYDFTRPLESWPNREGSPAKMFGTIRNGISGSAMVKFNFTDEETWAPVYTVMSFSRDSQGAGKYALFHPAA